MPAVSMPVLLLELGSTFEGRRDEIFVSKVALTILTINVLCSRKVLWEACSRAFLTGKVKTNKESNLNEFWVGFRRIIKSMWKGPELTH